MYPIPLTQGEHSFAKNCEEVSPNFQDIADGVRRTDEKKSEELIEAMAPGAGSAGSARPHCDQPYVSEATQLYRAEDCFPGLFHVFFANQASKIVAEREMN